MSALISSVGQLVNALFVDGGAEGGTPWVSSVVSTITSNPILLIGFVISLACLAVGVVKRLSRLG